ncbi:MAG TPA: Na+/H+ antiporter subunit E [Arenibacter sp.]|nr:Na+/H+ antiporter subunit E [Arenibacter sp.]
MNLLLSFIWVALTGSMYYSNFLFGYLLGFFLLWVMNKNETDKRYFYRVPKIIGFAFYFLYEMMVANLQVAYDVITPKYFFKPGIVRFPLKATSDLEINLLSMFISLTPGTILLDVSEDKKSIVIHVMYLDDREKFISRMQNSERKILDILR